MTEPIRPQKITIQRGEGLTQALQKLVRSMPNSIMTDGSISASEWNATMDALVEIQNERKNNGGEAIFSGGTDKTKSGWKNSFVVQAGQVIEFTAAEMTKLFKAMGVEVNPAPAEEPPVAPPTDPPVAPPVTSEIPEVVTPPPYNPPADDPNPPRNSLPQAALAQNLIPSNEQFPDRAGQVKKEGPLLNRRTVTYDENGYITKVETKNYTLDVARFDDGSVYEYKKTSIVANNEHIAVYNEEGKPKVDDGEQDTFLDLCYRIHRLDENGNRVRSEFRNNATGEVLDYIDREYDENGNLTRKIGRNPDGTIYKSEEYVYDEHNRETQFISRDDEGNIKWWREYSYDEEGNKTEIWRNPDGSIVEDE